MKSGLRDRNNIVVFNDMPKAEFVVSMKSGLRDRNNFSCRVRKRLNAERLNEVRSWRPEQSVVVDVSGIDDTEMVSMKSGLGDRNNQKAPSHAYDRLYWSQ